MTETLLHASRFWLPLASAVLLIALSLYSWRHRSMPGALPFALGSLLATPLMAAEAMQYAAVDPAAKIPWIQAQPILQLSAMTAITCFVLAYTWAERWLTRRNLILLSVAPLLLLGLTLTNDFHHLAWRSAAPGGGLPIEPGPSSTSFIAYSYGLGLLNLIVFVWLFLRSPQHRWPAAIMAGGQLASRGLFALQTADVLGSNLFLDVAPVTLVFAMYAIALFGFRIFDPLPAARATALAQMREGMIVLDAQWRIVSLNPAAASMLATSETRARGKTLAEVLPAFPDLSERLTLPASGPVEISLRNPRAHCCALDASVLKDFRGSPIGHLLLLRDVTEERRAQTRILEQRWAEATLQERELLAHELHDNLSQSLAFLNVQAQAVQIYLHKEQGADARASLARLAQVSREMQSDVRELIGNLLAVSLPSEGLCATLRQVVARFEEQTGQAVSLDINGPALEICDASVLPPATGVQVVRIVQEALANIRKHAGRPGRISVLLRTDDAQMLLAIEDDGAGFDPALPGREGHYGLQVMHQRAARIGGQVTIHSAPGRGARVEVRVPVNLLHYRRIT